MIVNGTKVVAVALTEEQAAYIAEVLSERQARVENLDCPEEAWCGEQDAFHDRKGQELELLDEVLPKFQ